MTVLSLLQDPTGKGGTATAVGFYRDWMDHQRPGQRIEMFLDDTNPGGIRRLAEWSPGSPEIPRVLPRLQVPPYIGARVLVSRARLDQSEVHVVGASAMHGWAAPSGADLVWFATTLGDERSPAVLRGRHWSRRLAYAAAAPVLGRLERSVLRGAARVIAMSEHTADVAVASGVDASRVSVVLVPVDTEVFMPPASGSERRGALFVGRANDPRKGYDRLRTTLGSTPSLREQGVTVVSPEAPGDVGEGIRWVGRVDDLAGLYQRAEMLLLPSRQEGLGIVALEAMACGTPVVARRCGGIDRILEVSGGGLVCQTSAAFTSAVQSLLNEPDQGRSLGRAGRHWVSAHASRASMLADQKLFGSSQ